MLLTYKNGKSAFISSAFGSYFRSTYRVLGSKAQIEMERAYAVPKDRATKIFLHSDDIVKEIPIDPADHFKLMLNDFCKEISLGAASSKKYEEDLLAQARILDAARKSFAEKRFVDIAEVV